MRYTVITLCWAHLHVLMKNVWDPTWQEILCFVQAKLKQYHPVQLVLVAACREKLALIKIMKCRATAIDEVCSSRCKSMFLFQYLNYQNMQAPSGRQEVSCSCCLSTAVVDLQTHRQTNLWERKRWNVLIKKKKWNQCTGCVDRQHCIFFLALCSTNIVCWGLTPCFLYFNCCFFFATTP